MTVKCSDNQQKYLCVVINCKTQTDKGRRSLEDRLTI